MSPAPAPLELPAKLTQLYIRFTVTFPSLKLAFSVTLSRHCSHPRLLSKCLTRPLSSQALRVNCFSTAQKAPVAARPPLRAQLRPNRTRFPPVHSQVRFCASQDSGTFQVMASDRDILPSWSVDSSPCIYPPIPHAMLHKHCPSDVTVAYVS
jgi:hypothetical protein